ncbi:alpha/beta fold hydrolase [Pedobacter nyackensis]|uniref:alpha/beta fold hydrolase n=1 Tax=Pedobacter nyackensis TaxID=475255 RepID=UPI0037441B57
MNPIKDLRHSVSPVHLQSSGCLRPPAWKTKPSWYQVSDHDPMIPPETQKEMADRIKAKKIIHLNSGHASLATQPKEVTALILEAVEAAVFEFS